MVSISLVANIYNEVHALPGWLETHLPYFDEIKVLHAGPNGEYSDDGTLELLKKWNIPVEFTSIDEGFGVVRTKALRMAKCDYVMLLDADERFYPLHNVLQCSGTITPHSEVDSILQGYDFRDLVSKPVDWNNVARLGENLSISKYEVYNQGQILRDILNTNSPSWAAVATIRRHWHDFSFKRPTQNWYFDPDLQLRVVKNHPSIGFEPNTRMHERLVGADAVYYADSERGPFFDHMHFTFKRMEQEQRAHDVAVYNAINEGKKPLTKKEFNQCQQPII